MQIVIGLAMHLTILMTNTDESAFAEAFPKDGEKFEALISLVRPEWSFSVFNVKDNEFPEDLTETDGLILTGSPASVNSPEPWVDNLMTLIQTAYSRRVPMFGACFGHQAIARALGGHVSKNPKGWVFGSVQMDSTAALPWIDSPFASLNLYAAHVEQVSKLPNEARVVSEGPDCRVAGFVMGDFVYTTQYHPEMTEAFFKALVEELSSKLPSDVVERAKVSLSQKSDMRAYAETVAKFFEHAQKANPLSRAS